VIRENANTARLLRHFLLLDLLVAPCKLAGHAPGPTNRPTLRPAHNPETGYGERAGSPARFPAPAHTARLQAPQPRNHPATGAADERTRDARSRLVQLYEATGRPDQAEPYRAVLP
jgi:hypothetical protein